MARSRRTVRYFASQAHISPEEALQLLQQGGVTIKRAHDVIRKNQIRNALFLLGIARTKPQEKRKEEKRIQIARPVLPVSGDEEQQGAVVQENLPVVGHETQMSYITSAEVERIHWKLVEDFSDKRDPIIPAGVSNRTLFESAVARSRTGLGRHRKYPTIEMAAAALIHSLILNHPFHNGNKRTALVSTLVFLDKNGWSLRIEEDELFDFVVSIARHGLSLSNVGVPLSRVDAEVYIIADWMRGNIHDTSEPSRILTFRDLRKILNQYDCQFSPGSTGSKMNISRGSLKTQVWHGGEGRECDWRTIAKVRHDLELDADHGYDDDMFYNAEDHLPEFIMKYRKILDRLARA